MKTIIIQVTNEWIFIAEDFGISITSTNIPIKHLQFKEGADIYWEAKMISFDKQELILSLEVVDFFPKMISVFENQSPKSMINSLVFEPLYWNHLQGFLTTYQKKQLEGMITSERPKKDSLEYAVKLERISLSEINFNLGYVTFIRTYKWDQGEDEKRIDLPDSIPEYNYIKAYFIKILGKRTIDVVYDVAISGDEMYINKVSSSDVNMINRDSVRVLKTGKMNHWSSRKPKFKPNDQDLFTFEEALECYEDEAFGNVDVFEKDLLFHLIEKESVRNRNQLKYLSGIIQNEKETLLLTLVPQFGFVFTFRGEEMNHYVWELLNSHATYIWSMPHHVRSIPILENEIKTVSAHGRSEYRAHFENTEKLYFNVLIHKTKGTNYEEYFERWKLSLQNLLV